MAEKEIHPTIKVKYLGKDGRPNGLLIGGIPVKGQTYDVRKSLWEIKDRKDWEEVNPESKKPKAPKKKTSSS